MCENFMQNIKLDGHKYEVCIFCERNITPHSHHCQKMLMSLFKRNRQTPQLLREYYSIIQDQLDMDIVEIVPLSSHSITDWVIYLPHHVVVCQNKPTSKLWIVYDASAKSMGPSLNGGVLWTKFGKLIFDIILCFQLQQMALVGTLIRHLSCIS